VIINVATSAQVHSAIYQDSDATVTLTSVASGTALRATVTGRRESAESQPSEPVNFTLG
jgi:hypothetical protein